MKLTEAQENLILKNLNAVHTQELYDNMLDEVYPETEVAGYKYQTSEALAKLDPIAYRCGFADYIDSLVGDTLIEVGGEYYDMDEVNDLLDEHDAA